MNLKINKSSIVTIIEYLVAFCIILENRSVYQVIQGRDYHIDEMVIVLMAVLVAVCFLGGVCSPTKRVLLLVLFIECYLFFFFGVNVLKTESKIQFSRHFLLFVPLMLLICAKTNYNTAQRIMDKYSKIMVVLTAAAVFFWLFGSIFPIISPTGVITYLWGNIYIRNGFFGVYFESSKDTFLFLDIYRNAGIFTEPPMNSLNISLALLFRYFLDDKCKGKLFSVQNIILMIGIMTCISFTGVGIIVYIVAIHLLGGSNTSNRLFKRIVVVLVAIIAGNNAFQLFSAKMATASSLVRLDDYVVGLRAWLRSPFFGGGYGVRTYKMFLSSWRSTNTGFSNSVMWILSQGGICLFLFYFIPTILLIRISYMRDKKNVMFWTIGIIYLWVTTSFAYQYVSLLLVTNMISMSLILKKRNETNFIGGRI